MNKWHTTIVLSIGLFIAGAIVVPAHTAVSSYTEDFTTTTYKDTINTSADWNISAGELRLFPFAPTVVGNYDTPGNALGTFVSGDYVYVADHSSGLQIIDISNPTTPALAGAYSTPGSAWRVVIAGDHAYVADYGSGLLVIDISDPTTPTLAGSYNTTGGAYDVVVAGDHAYVADFTSGLVVVDISDPTAPALAGSYDTPGNAYAVFVSGDHAYVGDDLSGLQVIDISDPTAPTLAGAYDTPGNARNVYVDGDHAWVADTYSGLQVIDISDPTAPTLAGSYLTSSSVRDVFVSGDWAYLADYADGLTMLDISDPTMPTLADNLDTPGTARGVFVSGTRAYVADYGSGLQVIDVAEWMTPVTAGNYDTPGALYGVCVSGNHAYVAAGGHGLMVIDISDPTAPAPVGSALGWVLDVFISGDHAYAAVADSGLHVFDVSDPTAPVRVGARSSIGNARGVFVAGDHAYVAAYDSNLQIVDISDPTAPVSVGGYDTPGVSYQLYVAGDHAYVADFNAGLRVIDISDPAAPTAAGSYNTSYARGIFVSGDHAFLVDERSGLEVIDISDPTTPTLIGSLDTAEEAHSVVVSGDMAFVTDGNSGIYLIDISDPTAPLLKSIHNTPAFSYDVVVSGDHAFVAAAASGLQAVRVRQEAFELDGNTARSLTINTGAADILKARVTTTQQGAVSWFLSVNGGATWESFTFDGTLQTFTVAGSDLRWRTEHLWPGSGVNPGVSSVTIDWFVDAPAINAITDIPNDQGKQVRVEWTRSGHDFMGDSQQIVEYAVYRKVDPDLAHGSVPGVPPEFERLSPAARENALMMLTTGWDFLLTVPVLVEDTYSVVVPTLADSTIVSGEYLTTFRVTALTATPGVYFHSDPDSGYSVDNLSPMAPQGVAAAYNTGGGNQLAWDPPVDVDFQYFRVYRGLTPDFTHHPRNLVGGTVTPAWTDPTYNDPSVFYKITAVDFSGNESDPASPQTATVVGTPKSPAETALFQNIPNPFNPATTIRYSLREAGDVTLTVFDAAGRRVLTLVDAAMPAGVHDVAWDGVDHSGSRVASGVYFYRITAGAFTQTRKMVMLK